MNVYLFLRGSKPVYIAGAGEHAGDRRDDGRVQVGPAFGNPPTVGSYGVAVAYQRGTPVRLGHDRVRLCTSRSRFR